MECCVFVKRLSLKRAVYKNYAKPAIMYGNIAWCLKESEIEIFRMTETSMIIATCGVHLKDRNVKD